MEYLSNAGVAVLAACSLFDGCLLAGDADECEALPVAELADFGGAHRLEPGFAPG